LELLLYKLTEAWAWAWGVLSPMTAGSVGAFFIYFLTDFDVIE